MKLGSWDLQTFACFQRWKAKWNINHVYLAVKCGKNFTGKVKPSWHYFTEYLKILLYLYVSELQRSAGDKYTVILIFTATIISWLTSPILSQ